MRNRIALCAWSHCCLLLMCCHVPESGAKTGGHELRSSEARCVCAPHYSVGASESKLMQSRPIAPCRYETGVFLRRLPGDAALQLTPRVEAQACCDVAFSGDAQHVSFDHATAHWVRTLKARISMRTHNMCQCLSMRSVSSPSLFTPGDTARSASIVRGIHHTAPLNLARLCAGCGRREASATAAGHAYAGNCAAAFSGQEGHAASPACACGDS